MYRIGNFHKRKENYTVLLKYIRFVIISWNITCDIKRRSMTVCEIFACCRVKWLVKSGVQVSRSSIVGNLSGKVAALGGGRTGCGFANSISSGIMWISELRLTAFTARTNRITVNPHARWHVLRVQPFT